MGQTVNSDKDNESNVVTSRKKKVESAIIVAVIIGFLTISAAVVVAIFSNSLSDWGDNILGRTTHIHDIMLADDTYMNESLPPENANDDYTETFADQNNNEEESFILENEVDDNIIIFADENLKQ